MAAYLRTDTSGVPQLTQGTALFPGTFSIPKYAPSGHLGQRSGRPYPCIFMSIRGDLVTQRDAESDLGFEQGWVGRANVVLDAGDAGDDVCASLQDTISE
jgi:hypothetical protein